MLFNRTHNSSLRVHYLKQIREAVSTHDGVAYLKCPVTGFADDVCGEIPITVRSVKGVPGDASNLFDLDGDYTTEHLDNDGLELICRQL